MDELANHLPRPIKEVITEFPELAAILNEYDIGCGTCMIGDCLFKDIVSIHNLPRELEQAMMARLAAAISPAGEGKLLQPAAVSPKKSREKTYSPPIKRLVD